MATEKAINAAGKYTMKELAQIISYNIPDISKKDAELFKSVQAMDKRIQNKEKVKKAEFVKMVDDIETALGDDFKMPPTIAIPNGKVENRVKPGTTPLKKADKEKDASDGSKKDQKKVDLADSGMFPKEITLGDNTYQLCPEVKTMKQFKAEVQKGTGFIFTFYWTQRLLRQYEYAGGEFNVPKEGFENDLDIATPIYVSDNDIVVYCISAVTESLYQVMPDHFEEFEGVRYSRGIEFQLYKSV